MALRDHPMAALRQFLPSDTAFGYILELIDGQGIELVITKDRKSIYGNFQVKKAWRNEKKITVNGTLRPYQFYITLIHEIAHMFAYDRHGWKIKSHGKEWKSIYSGLLLASIAKHIFPAQLSKAVEAYAKNPKSSSCSDEELSFALHAYEKPNSAWKPLGMLGVKPGQTFVDSKGTQYQMIRKMRKNYLVLNTQNKHEYVAPPSLEVRI